MIARFVIGQSINQRRDDLVGFDAFSHCQNQGIFALCDGANSCRDSGLAAQWLCQKLVSEAISVKNQDELSAVVYRLHAEMQIIYPETASTALWAKTTLDGIWLSSVGDSSLRVYQRRWSGWGRWAQVCQMPRDLDVKGHPSQLIGSEVLHTIHHKHLLTSKPIVVLMMSDGAANTLSEDSVDAVLQNLGRTCPSKFDLDYLSTVLTTQALDERCHDDVSVAMIWVQWQ